MRMRRRGDARARCVAALGVACLSLAGCRQEQNLSTFAVERLPASMNGIDWIELARDVRGILSS